MSIGSKLLQKALAEALRDESKVAAKALTEKEAKRGLVNLKLRDKPAEEAIAAAQSEEHLFPKTEGGYVGGPRDIETRRDLATNRRRMDRTLGEATQDIEASGETVGDWYPSQQRGVRAISEPHQEPRVAEARGLFSPQTDPEGETGFMLQGWNRYARGEPVGVAHTGRQGTEFEAAMGEDRPMKLGEKTGIYAQLSDPARGNPLFGTNDFRQAQFQGYTEPSGKPQTTGLKPAQHAFMDAEGLLLTQRARAKALGGRSDWTGSMAQEVPWIAEKADSLQRRFPKRFTDTPEGRNAAIREASKTGEDFLLKHAAGATYERVPSVSSGHAPSIPGAPTEEKLAYGNAAPWTDEAGRDVIYSGQGALQLPTTRGHGIWEGNVNPNQIAQPLADLVPQKGVGASVSPGMLQQLRVGEHLRGLVDAQDAAAAHLPMTQNTRAAGTKTHALLEHDTPLTEAETRSLAEQLPPGYSPTPSPRGTMLMQWGKPSNKVAQDVEAMQDTIGQGQLPLQRAGMDSVLIPVLSRQRSSGASLPIAPGRGIATSRFLRQAARSPQGSVLGMSESPAIRRTIAQAHARDAQMEALGGEPIRQDIQKTRRFLSDADWAKAVDLIRKGMTPTAAVAALGYSLSGMAGEEAR